jgi:hypothetical protein
MDPMNKPAYLTSRPTYTLDQVQEAKAGWAGFDPEWEPFRRLAATGPGIIFPPSGSKWDQWDEAHPSQRAILIRAIRETPDLLRWAIRGAKSPSWSAVITRLLAGRDEMREQLDLIPDEPSLDPAPRQAAYRLGEILTILKDSGGSHGTD